MQGRDPPGKVTVSPNLPKTADHQIVESSLPLATFPEPQNRSGLLKFRKRKRPAESATQSKPPTQRPQQQQQRESIPSYFAPPSIPQVRFSAQPQPRFFPFPMQVYPNIYQPPNPFQQSQPNPYQQTSPLYHSQPSIHPLFHRMASPFNSA
ncbi:pleckstrin homology-like domain family A member 1 [Clytia hemisphaerica]|uniref:pleckstrin homology-like domain family A member 1 n=1 Tax=Clytia hemisphaerica TaxID=252671 RepID=UPI0034D579F0